MKTRYKGLLAGAALLLMIPAVPVFLALALDQEYYKRQISDEVEAKTGRPLLIEGDLSLAFGFRPKIAAETIRYPNASWGSQPWAVEVGRAEFTFDLWALLRGKLLLADVALHGAKLQVEKNGAGAYNLMSGRPRAPRVKNASMPLWLSVAGVDVIDSQITVITRNRHWDIVIDQGQARSDGHDRPVFVEARGALEETPVSASATLGSLETLFALRPSAISIDGWVGADTNRLSATGRVANLSRWRGVDLQLQYQVAQLAELSRLFSVELPNIQPFTGRATLRQPTHVRTMQLHAVEAESTQFGLLSTLTGRIADLYRLAGIDLRLTGAGSLDQALAERAGVIASSDLDTRVAATVSGSKRDLDLIIESATSENPQIALEAGGTFNRSERAWRGSLPVSLTVKDFNALSDLGELSELSDFGARIGPWLTQLEPVTATARLRREPGLWHLRDLQLRLAREAWTLNVAGAIDDLNGATTGRLSVAAAAADLGPVQPLFANPLPPLTALELGAEVAFERDAWHATVERFTGRWHGVSLSASGAVGDLRRWREIDLAVSARVDDLTRMPPLATRALPRMGPVRARARLTDDRSGAFHLTDLTASNADSPLKVKAEGEIRDLGESMRADIDLDLNLDSLEPLHSWLPDAQVAELLGMAVPLKVSGKLYSLGQSDWGIRDIEAAAARVDAALAGEITAVQPLAARLHLTLGRFALAELPKGWKIPRPRGGELDMALDLVAEQSRWRIENLRAEVNNAAGVVLAARGDIERLRPFETRAMKLQFKAASLAALALPGTRLLDTDLPASGDLIVSAGASGNRAEVDVAFGSSDARGTLEWRLSDDPQAPHWVDAKLTSERVDVGEMLGRRTGKSRSRGFSTKSIDTDWIHGFNGRIDLRAAEARIADVEVRDVSTQMALHGGTLRQTFSARMGQGGLTGSLAVDANARPFLAELKMDGKRLDTAGLAAFRRDDFLDQGAFDLEVDVLSEGVSQASLMANASGSVSFALNQAKMKNQSLDILGGDIFSNLVTAVNPFRSVGEYVDIECAVMRFDIDRGVATIRDNLAVKTDRVTLSGAGFVDLSDQSLKIVILPKARKGFGINASSLAKVVRIGGTLAEPKIEADASRLLETGAAFIAAFYSAGWSLIAKGLFDRIQANADVCGLNGRAGAPDGGQAVEENNPDNGSG